MQINQMRQDFIPLLPALSSALQKQQITVAVGLWKTISNIALLPFALHTILSDHIQEFPLSATITLFPSYSSDRQLLAAPICSPAGAYNARMLTRWYRHELGIAHNNDLKLADWEEGFRQHQISIANQLLGSNSYLSVDTVSLDGSIAQGSRPILGRYAKRKTHRLSLRHLGRGIHSDSALRTLATSDLIIINVQSVRGQRMLEITRRFINLCQSRAAIIIAASPSDLLALNIAYTDFPIFTYGVEPQSEHIQVIPVARDRLQAEQQFQFAIADLRNHSSVLDMALDIAERCWWIARNSLDTESARSNILPQLSRAENLIHQLTPADSGVLNSARALITATLADPRGMQERLDQVLQACTQYISSAIKKTAIIVRNNEEVLFVQHKLMERWELSAEEVLEIGIEIKSVWDLPQQYSQIITSSYVGMRTLDVLLNSHAYSIHLILDPMEARIAAFHIEHLQRVFLHINKEEPSQILDKLFKAIRMHTAHIPETAIHIELSSFFRTITNDQVPGLSINYIDGAYRSSDQIYVLFTDGTSLICTKNQRFDVLGSEIGNDLSQVTATELRPGDELILIERHEQEQFSERLMKILDESVLKEKAQQRWFWLAAVASAAHIPQKRTYKSIQTGLQKRGVYVSYATVRSWVPKLEPQDIAAGIVPANWDNFKTLADEVGIQLPEATLSSWFRATKALRILHRKAGRALVRLMRQASVGSLDVRTLDDIERQWGFNTRDLVQATCIRVIDDIITLPS